MDDASNLSHSKWECKYHVVFIPKCRRKALYEQLRRHLVEVFRKLAAQKESQAFFRSAIAQGRVPWPDKINIDGNAATLRALRLLRH